MVNLLENVNLAAVVFSEDGKNISFSFTDMYHGRQCACLECNSVYIFNYHCVFELDGFPAFVGEVWYEELSQEAIAKKLEELNFGFYVLEDPTGPLTGNRRIYTPKESKVYFVRIEGGELSLIIICGKIDFKEK